jgi:hypothetical protein
MGYTNRILLSARRITFYRIHNGAIAIDGPCQHEANGVLTVDRNSPAEIHMLPPPRRNKKSDVASA